MFQIARSHKVIGYNNRGEYHDDMPSTEENSSSPPKIICIKIHVGVSSILGLKVIWDTHTGRRRGKFSRSGKTENLLLCDDELVTRIEGTTMGSWDSDRRMESFGDLEGETFGFNADTALEEIKGSRMGLFSFETWMLLSPASAILLYEKMTRSHSTSLEGKLLALRPTFIEYPTHSATSFGNDDMALQYECLASPTIALHVGTGLDTVTLHAREDMLCKVPFFAAALLGGFKEAIEKTISMPEDSPHIISAMLEYLATTSYTYAYNTVPIDKEAEVSFHLDLYAAAKKYGAVDLMEDAVRNFVGSLGELEDCPGAIRLRLWRHAYDVGLRVKGNWNTHQHIYVFGQEIMRQTRMVLKECKNEFDAAVREVEWFGLDFITIASDYYDEE
ncbi:hypothetical protein Q9L58_009672 [Maublancomyces gigas]|uniref:BTB domain-containing protein n=1 Tax=Discina gigas TaxID=1032678 RepID=A0ABR3G683_9PEZI